MAMLQFLRNRCGSKTSATRSTSARNHAAETSNHLRTGEPAATRRVALRSRIPTGFRPKAQGCEGRGSPSDKHPQPQRGCGQFVSGRARDVCHNAVGVVSIFRQDTQGRRYTPTLGWRPQSLWDCSERGSATSQTRARRISRPPLWIAPVSARVGCFVRLSWYRILCCQNTALRN